jgi:hypothetical protein
MGSKRGPGCNTVEKANDRSATTNSEDGGQKQRQSGAIVERT